MNSISKIYEAFESKKYAQNSPKFGTPKFPYLASRDESWFSYYYDNKRQCALDSNEVDERVEKTHFSHQAMITIFISINDLVLLDVKPSNQSINAEYFVNNILTPLKVNVNVVDEKKHRKLLYVHYVNARDQISHEV